MEPNHNIISEQPGKLGSPPHVIEMTVRMENHGRFEAALANPFDNPRGLLAGIIEQFSYQVTIATIALSLLLSPVWISGGKRLLRLFPATSS